LFVDIVFKLGYNEKIAKEKKICPDAELHAKKYA